ncbi:MAG: c-type cytochrome [Proteobacteria bacterium]|nr:c-type cytochrome [Pseudomonadota bacterium]
MRGLLSILLLPFLACSGEATPPAKQPPQPTPKSIDVPATPKVAVGERPQAYMTLCAICHGPEAKGYAADHAPSLVTSTFLESATDDFLFRSIASGRPGTSMAAYGKASNGPLDDAQIGEIVAWLRSKGPAPKPNLAVGPGDAKRGAEVYAKSCHSCHGDMTALGEGISLANATFRQMATPSFVRHAIVWGRPDTKMLAFKGTLTDGQIDDVVAFIFDGLGAMASPPPQQLPAPTGKEPLVINPTGKDPTFSPRSDPCTPGDLACVPNKRYVPSAQIAQALADKRKMIIIDARPASDWMRVHVTGAVSIPHHDPKRLDELKNDGTWVLAYCACPHHLSGEIVDMLKAKGFKNVAILDEGILEWHRLGYPVVAAPGVTPPPKQTEPQ